MPDTIPTRERKAAQMRRMRLVYGLLLEAARAAGLLNYQPYIGQMDEYRAELGALMDKLEMGELKINLEKKP